MIDSITLRNFKSYKSAALHLAPLTLLIGANASGKSNALEAIRILSWLAEGRRTEDIERSIQESNSMVRGYYVRIFYNHEESFEIGCQIAESPERWDSLSISIANKPKLFIINEEIVKNGKEEGFL